jgi:hypothetical protein
VPAAFSVNVTVPLIEMLPLKAGFSVLSEEVHVEPGDDDHLMLIDWPTTAVLELAEIVAKIDPRPVDGTT